MKSIWAYPADIGHLGHTSLAGYSVETPDGTLGQVERQMDVPGRQHLVVDTGVWVFGKSVLIPAGVVHAIDTSAKTVTVTRTKDEIKAAPRFVLDSQTTEAGYLTEVGAYYAALGAPALL
ncbi:PRC-barrel domain containing protein [Streptomyces sp. NPDC048650]|uniref:PRC-barrel domain containing protein n=1 Tax=unclassified Streptomyces TaxID=2593676 RepID=UPI00371764F0